MKIEKENEPKVVALASVLMGRAAAAARLGQSYGTSRDIYEALGYNKLPQYMDYYARWERQDIAKRIIEAPVSATWREKPEIKQIGDSSKEETRFEKEWNDLVKKLRVYHYLSRADKICGIGRYSILLIGYKDQNALEPQLPVENAKEILYLRPYAEDHATVHTWVERTDDPRFGLPEIYNVQFSTGGDTSKSISKKIHYSRILHLAEGLYEDDVYGTPRLRPVLNRLHDLELVSGGSAEMFWRGGFPGFGFKNAEGADFGTGQELTALEDEIEEYVHGLKRYMKLQNLDVDQLSTQVADPTNHVKILVSLISAATGIPNRILLGSERGELASSQDKENWADRIDERKKDHAEDRILRPFIDRQIEYGILSDISEEGYEVQWSDSHSESEKESAEVDKTKIETAAAYVNAMGLNLLIPPQMFLEKYMNFTQTEIDTAITYIDEELLKEKEELEQERKDEEEK